MGFKNKKSNKNNTSKNTKIVQLTKKHEIYGALQNRITKKHNQKIVKMDLNEYIETYKDTSLESFNKFDEISTYEKGIKYKFNLTIKGRLDSGLLPPNNQNVFWIENDIIYKETFLIDVFVKLCSDEYFEKLVNIFQKEFGYLFTTNRFMHYSDDFLTEYSPFEYLQERKKAGAKLGERFEIILKIKERRNKINGLDLD